MRETIQKRQGPDICGQRSPFAGGGRGTGTSCLGPAACRLTWAQVWRGQAQGPASLTGSPWRSEPGSRAGSGHLPCSSLRCWRPGAVAGRGFSAASQHSTGEGGPEAGRCGAAPPTPCYRHCAFKALGSTQLRASREPWHPASLGLLIRDTQSHTQTHRGAPPPGDTAREMCKDAAKPCQQKHINSPPLLGTASPSAPDQALDFPRLTLASGNSRAACPTSTGAGPTLPPPLCSRSSCSPFCWQPGF